MAVLAMSGQDLAERLGEAIQDSVEQWDTGAVWVKPSRIQDVALFLRDDPSTDFQFLNAITAVDYVEYFELVYHLTSFQLQHTGVVKSRVYGREALSVPSVYQVWRGADFQEREVWELMGLHFEGHPNMKRIMLWEGFDGHPLRKDYL